MKPVSQSKLSSASGLRWEAWPAWSTAKPCSVQRSEAMQRADGVRQVLRRDAVAGRTASMDSMSRVLAAGSGASGPVSSAPTVLARDLDRIPVPPRLPASSGSLAAGQG
jgi:hypothetical protein